MKHKLDRETHRNRRLEREMDRLARLVEREVKTAKDGVYRSMDSGVFSTMPTNRILRSEVGSERGMELIW